MLKKLICLLACVCFALGLCACAGENGTTQNGSETIATESVSEGAENSEDLKGVFVVSDQKLEIGMDLNETVLTALGDPVDTQNAPSCHFDGEDTIYVYENYSLYTYADGDKNVLYLIELSGAGVSTVDGIAIGATCEDVKGIYGTAKEESETYLLYETSSSLIRFSHDGTAVTLIEYEEKE